jgi:hypothetical protein
MRHGGWSISGGALIKNWWIDSDRPNDAIWKTYNTPSFSSDWAIMVEGFFLSEYNASSNIAIGSGSWIYPQTGGGAYFGTSGCSIGVPATLVPLGGGLCSASALGIGLHAIKIVYNHSADTLTYNYCKSGVLYSQYTVARSSTLWGSTYDAGYMWTIVDSSGTASWGNLNVYSTQSS